MVNVQKVEGILYEKIKTGSRMLMKYIYILIVFLELNNFQTRGAKFEIIITLYKKRSRNDKGNYRSISLLSYMGKIFTNVFNN